MTNLATQQWSTSSPDIYLTPSYSKSRSGADMKYQIGLSISAVNDASFGYPIYAKIYLNNELVKTVTLKSASPNQWDNPITYLSEEFTIENKTSGTVPLSINLYSGSGSTRNETYNYSLPIDPAGSSLGTINNFTIGDSINIPITKYNSSFYDSLTVEIGNTIIKTIDGIANNDDVTFTSDELTSIYAALPKTTAGTFIFSLTTYTDSSKNTSVGTSNKTAIGVIQSSIVPIINSCSLIEATNGIASQFGVFVQNKSTLNGTIDTNPGSGSSISTIIISINGTSYTLTGSNRTFTTDILLTSGDNNYSVVATDARGRQATFSGTFVVVVYEIPKATTLTVKRCTFDGTNYTENDEGTYAKIIIAGSVSPVNDGTNDKNTKTYTLGYRISGSTGSYTNIAITDNDFDLSETLYVSDLSVDNVYEFKLTVNDFFNIEATKSALLLQSYTLINFNASGKGLAIGKLSSKDAVQLGMDICDKSDQIIRNGLALYEINGATDVNTTLEELVLSKTNTPDTDFWFIRTMFYSNKTTSSNRVQTAYPYNKEAPTYMRYFYNNTWSEWMAASSVLDYAFGDANFYIWMTSGLLVQSGRVSITPTAANTPTKASITYDLAYTSLPAVLVDALSNAIGTKVTGVSATNVTNTISDIYVTRTNTTATTIQWFAVGYKAP